MKTVIEKIKQDISQLDEDLESEIITSLESLPAKRIHELEKVINQSKTVEDLYYMIGLAGGVAATGEDPTQSGKSMFLNNMSTLSQSICNNKLLWKYCKSATVIDITTCSGLIMGGLINAKSVGINIPLLSLLIARIGIRKFCSKFWVN